MKHPRRRRPSPALAIACLALFVALGGTVWAATKIDGHTIRVRSLPGNRLEVRSLPGNRLQRGTIPGNRIAARSLKGEQIDVGTLGQVPSAAHADSADTARRAATATAADHATDANTVNGRSVGCPAGKREFAGACWDLDPHLTPLNAIEAAGACAAEGGELPEALTLMAFNRQPGVAPVLGGEWTDTMRVTDEDLYGVVVVENVSHVRLVDPTLQHLYRCVVPLLH
jgi:hypothetical protein